MWPEAAPNGPAGSQARVRSARALASNARSATCTPEPSTPLSVKRWPSTRLRSGLESSTTSSASESQQVGVTFAAEFAAGKRDLSPPLISACHPYVSVRLDKVDRGQAREPS